MPKSNEAEALEALLKDDTPDREGQEQPEAIILTKGGTVNDPETILARRREASSPEAKAERERLRREAELPPTEEELSKHGTDEQPIPDDPGPMILVSQGDTGLALLETTKSVTVYLPKGKHPIIEWSGKWLPADVLLAIGGLRRGWRMYQGELRKGTKPAVQGMNNSEENDDARE